MIAYSKAESGIKTPRMTRDNGKIPKIIESGKTNIISKYKAFFSGSVPNNKNMGYLSTTINSQSSKSAIAPSTPRPPVKRKSSSGAKGSGF